MPPPTAARRLGIRGAGVRVPDHDDRGRVRAGHVHAVRLVVPRLALGLAAGDRGASAWSAAIVFAAVTRARHLRDEPGRPTIIAEYTPPPEIDALESAVLLGPHDEGDPGRGARAGGGRQHPHRRGRAQALRRREAQGAADRSRRAPTATAGCCWRACSRRCEPGTRVRVRPAPTPASRPRRRTSSRLANEELARRGLRREVPATRARVAGARGDRCTSALVFLAGMFAASSPRCDPLVPILLIVGVGARGVRRDRHWSRASR